MAVPWHEAFCGCLNSPVACCLISNCGLVGLSVVHCENKNEMDGDGGMMACLMTFFLCCIGAAINRNNVRKKYNLSGNCIVDCLLYYCGCACCMGSQEYREIQHYKETQNK